MKHTIISTAVRRGPAVAVVGLVSILLFTGAGCTKQTASVDMHKASSGGLDYGIDDAPLLKSESSAEFSVSVQPPANEYVQTTTSTTSASQSAPLTLDQKLNLKPSTMEIDATKQYSAVMHTSAGDITFELNAKMTPITVNNFVTLAQKGFYDNTIFHRVIKDFMIQGGDPKGDGTGGPGYKFADEPFQGDYTRGTLAMANAGPNTNGSQFFIMHQTNPLPKNYTIFGHVTAGMNVVDDIAEAAVGMSDSGEPSRPVKPVVVKSVEIVMK